MISWVKKRMNPQKPHSQLCYSPRQRPVWSETSYVALSKEGYQKNVIVYRCVSLIARSLSSVPWLLYQGAYKQEIMDHPLLTLLNCPSPRQAGSAFIEAVVAYFLLSGNAFIQGVYDDDGNLCELHPLRPDRTRVIVGDQGEILGYEYRIDQKVKTFLCDKENQNFCPILHLKLFHPLHDWYGLSPVEAAAQAIDQHNAVAGHNLSLLQHGGRPSGALMLRPGAGQVLTHEQRESLQQDLKSLYEGQTNAGRMMILEGDFEWKEMGLSPKDLDFIEGKNVSAREIAQAFGVPPMLVGVPGDATFANYKEARLHLWEDTILPMLEFLVAEFNLWLTPQYGEDLKLGYDVDEIPALAPKREQAWQKIAQATFLTINEKRQAVGYSPIPDGDRLMGIS